MSEAPPPMLEYQRPIRPPRNEPLGGPSGRFGVGAGAAFFFSICLLSTAGGSPDNAVDIVCGSVMGTPILIGIYSGVFLVAALVRRATVRGGLVERGQFQTYLTGAIVFAAPVLLFLLPAVFLPIHARSDDGLLCTMAVSFLLAAASPWVVFQRTNY